MMPMQTINLTEGETELIAVIAWLVIMSMMWISGYWVRDCKGVKRSEVANSIRGLSEDAFVESMAECGYRLTRPGSGNEETE